MCLFVAERFWLFCFADHDGAVDRVAALGVLGQACVGSGVTEPRSTDFKLTNAQAPAHFVLWIVDNLNFVLEPANSCSGYGFYRACQGT